MRTASTCREGEGDRLPTPKAIKGPLGDIIRAPSEALSRMTNLVYAGNYFGEIQSLATRQIEGLSGEFQIFLEHHSDFLDLPSGHSRRRTFI